MVNEATINIVAIYQAAGNSDSLGIPTISLLCPDRQGPDFRDENNKPFMMAGKVTLVSLGSCGPAHPLIKRVHGSKVG